MEAVTTQPSLKRKEVDEDKTSLEQLREKEEEVQKLKALLKESTSPSVKENKKAKLSKEKDTAEEVKESGRTEEIKRTVKYDSIHLN